MQVHLLMINIFSNKKNPGYFDRKRYLGEKRNQKFRGSVTYCFYNFLSKLKLRHNSINLPKLTSRKEELWIKSLLLFHPCTSISEGTWAISLTYRSIL